LVKTYKMQNEISVDELDRSLKRSADQFLVIDLMSKEDFAANHIPGAVNIPVEELNNRLAEIPKEKNIVVVCRRGLMKSDLALQQLHQSGFTTAQKLSGGTAGWVEHFKNNNT
jgi:rhodanese-related sulfurtransferase